MRTSPAITLRDSGQDTYIVLDDFGRIGRAWRGTDERAASREALIRDLVAGEYYNPVRIVAFNSAAGWSRDVTVDIADELRRRCSELDVAGVGCSVLGSQPLRIKDLVDELRRLEEQS